MMRENEAIQYNETSMLANFFDHAQLASQVTNLPNQPEERVGTNASAFAQQNYDLETVCLPQQLAWVGG